MEQARQAVLRVSQGWVAPARREAAVTPGGAARGHQAGAAHGAHGSRSGRSPDHGLVSLDPRLSPQAGRGPHRRLRARHGAGRRLCRQRRRGCAFERRALPAGGLVHRRAALAAARRHRRACRQQGRRRACSAIRACRRKRSMPPTWTRAPPCCRRCAGARCWSLARCDTPIAKALVRVGRPLHNDFRRGKLRPAKTEPAELHRLAGRGFCCRPIAAFRQVFEEAPGRMPRSLFSSQDHSVRGARDLRDASASPCARPGGPSFMDARQGPQFRFARHFRRVF